MDDTNQNKLTDQAALMAVVDDLLRQRPDIQLNDENRDIVRGNLLAELTSMINSHMIGLLSDEAAVKLEGMLDANATGEEISKFFEEQIPNLATEIAAIMMEYRQSFLDVNDDEGVSEADDDISPAPVQ